MTADEFLREYARLTDVSTDDWMPEHEDAWAELLNEAVHMLHDLLMTGSVNP
jgi:hypothetical protein